jgi:hypothetical protein
LPENDHRRQALGESHGQSADGIGEQPDDVGTFLRPIRSPSFSLINDEGGGDQGLQSDGGLNAAGGRVQVMNHRRVGHVHDDVSTTRTNIAAARRTATLEFPLPEGAATSVGSLATDRSQQPSSFHGCSEEVADAAGSCHRSLPSCPVPDITNRRVTPRFPAIDA